MPEFDPSKYLTKVGNADYLEVKWRLVWLRTDHPDADIDTQLISHPEAGEAIFKARISIPNGGAATGWGSETPNDFRDYLEKAETKAIGRALAALGYGTQFSPDHDFGSAQGKVVDAPVTKPKPDALQDVAVANRGREQQAPKSLYPARTGPTDAQRNFMNGLAKQLGWTIVGPDGDNHHDSAQMNAEIAQLYPGKTVDTLTVTEASAVIEQWQKIQSDRRERLGIK